MVDWKAGKLAAECTNEHGCSLTFLTKPCLASFSPLAEEPSLSRLPANNRHRGALRKGEHGWRALEVQTHQTTSGEGSHIQRALVRFKIRFSEVPFSHMKHSKHTILDQRILGNV